MLTIRFQRAGRKNDPSFRIVVLEKARSPKAGKRAQVSGTLKTLLVTKGIIQGKKVNVLGKKTPIKKDEPAKEEAKPEAKAEAPAEAPAEEAKAAAAPSEEAKTE